MNMNSADLTATGFDLRMIRTDNDVAAGFSIGNGVYRAQIPDGITTTGRIIEMPVVDVTFMMANGKGQHRVSLSPDSILPMIAALSDWKLKLDNGMSQVAPPPAPPSPGN